MKLTRIERSTCSTLTARANAALKVLGEEFGLTITVKGGGQFSDSTFQTKVEFALPSAGGELMTTEATAFRLNARLYGLQPDDLFREFTYAGKRVKIVGLKTRAHKMPILYVDLGTGKRYKCSEDAIKIWLDRARPAIATPGIIDVAPPAPAIPKPRPSLFQRQ